MDTPQIQNNFFDERMKLLGVTPENNIIKIKQTCINYVTNDEGQQVTGPGHGEIILVDKPIFLPHEKGIEIMPYSLDRIHFSVLRTGTSGKRNGKKFSIIRLEKLIHKPDGSTQKYQIPKGQGTPPFIPPSIIDKYEAKKQIKTLYLTEGYFKAFKAHLHGIDCIGLISITCMTDKATGKLHEDILSIIETCKVERLVWLTDADCREITKDPIDEEKDLYRRVNGFFMSVAKFQELTSSLEDVKKYFAHINEDLESESKGLDDLLINESESIKEIVKELNQFDKVSAGKYQGTYFTKFNVTYGLSNVRKYFMLSDVNQFYLHHVERRKDLKDKKFRFNGTLYSYDEHSGECVIQIPRDAKYYVRIGDDFYKHIKVPDATGSLTRILAPRQKSTIKDDCGTSIFQHITKLENFCNVPSHTNYQPIINDCYNVYSPFEFEPIEGDCTLTLNFIKHLFGTHEIRLSTGELVQNYELGLDYLQLLYMNPTQILPILCFVSEERSTGKSTFVKWLKKMFTNNCAVIGNKDFENGFNAHWVSKTVVAVDETKIDKHEVVELIKSMSTASKYMMNSKGKNQVELDIFMKFILLSNNEKNFINIDKQEVRFWVMKVKPFDRSKEIYNMENEMEKEIPEFLHFLQSRKMVTKQEFRHWFNCDYLKTDILSKIQDNSAPTLWKLIKSRITIMFEDFDVLEIPVTMQLMKDEVLKGYKYEDGYIKEVMKAQGYELSKPRRGGFLKRIQATGYADANNPENSDFAQSDTIHFRVQKIDIHGRCYEFKRKDFTDLGMSSEQLEIQAPPPDMSTQALEDLEF